MTILSGAPRCPLTEEEGFADLMIAFHGIGWEECPAYGKAMGTGDDTPNPPPTVERSRKVVIDLSEPLRMSPCWQMRNKGRCGRLACRFDHDPAHLEKGHGRRQERAGLTPSNGRACVAKVRACSEAAQDCR